MTTYVPVHGAWHGGWCWNEVGRALKADGSDVYTPTLTGLGERVHLASREVDLETHIGDVLGVLEFEDLGEPVRLVSSCTPASRTYVDCIGDKPLGQPKTIQADGIADYYEIRTGHDAMVTAPREVVELLRKIA